MMKKCVVFTILILGVIALTACSSNDNDTSYDNDATIGQIENRNAIYRPQNTVELEDGIRVQIAHANDDLLGRFDYIHEFDYREVQATRRGIIVNEFSEVEATIVIWADQKITELEVISVGLVYEVRSSGGEIVIPVDGFGLVNELLIGEALVITNIANISRVPQSGITFLDEDGVRRYFAIRENRAYIDGRFGLELREFENITAELPSDFQAWWREEFARSLIEQVPPVHSPELLTSLREQAGISEYGLQVAANFLQNFDSIFEGVFREEFQWRDGEAVVTGRYVGRKTMTGQTIITYDLPKFTFRWTSSEEETGFFDRNGNKIINAPWINIWEFDGWYDYNFADYFKLFNFGNNGIPDIVVHFQQTAETCYMGFSEIFRYIDGEFKRLEMVTYTIEGERFTGAGLGTFHEFLLDTDGRVITFIDDGMVSIGTYANIIFENGIAEFHKITTTDFHDGEYWQEHHWSMLGATSGNPVTIDSWLFHTPTIIGTDINMTLHSLDDLNLALYAYIQHRRQ